MEGIGGEVESYKFDIDASKKLSDLRAVILIMEEANSTDEEYCRGVRDAIETIKNVIEKQWHLQIMQTPLKVSKIPLLLT